MTTQTQARRIWSGPIEPGPQTRLFRREFNLDAVPASATLRVFGDLRYHVWVNDHYVGRGPVFHHPHRIVLDPYDVAPLLRPGVNVIAAVVHTPNIGVHNGIPSGEPGLIAELTWSLPDGTRGSLVSDASWRATHETGWRSPTPKRCWALAYIEEFDAAAAPRGWRSPGFDDSAWFSACATTPGASIPGATLIDRPLPNLRYRFAPPRRLLSFEATRTPWEPLTAQTPGAALAKAIDEAAWERPNGHASLSGSLDPKTGGGLEVHGLTPAVSAAVRVDLGAMHVGLPVFEIHSDGPGVIDFAWSEASVNGRPQWCRKGVSYADRIHTPGGPLRWQPIQFSGMRYLGLVLRGFTGDVRIERLGAIASEPDLDWRGAFHCDDTRLSAVFELCERTVRVGTQEGLMDCPTREQAPYVGDGHPVAEWIARLTGDTRHWAYLVREQFARQSASGLIRGVPFSGRDDTLIDYELLAITGTRDYLNWTGDRDTVRDVLPAARRVLAWFDSQRDDRGLFALDWRDMKFHTGQWENRFDPTGPRIEDKNLFIDHPGLGWHNVGEPGIDRRGTNCAINALLAQAYRAMAELEDAAGSAEEAQSLRDRADRLAARIAEVFYDPSRGLFVDGVLDGAQLSQVSQQTNTWAVMAGACDDAKAREIMQRIVASDDPQMARSGPYFWWYMFRAMARLGLHREALEAARTLWPPMIDGGATTLWETFAGDHLDSWCHPWSGAPLPLLLTHVAGLPEHVPPAGVAALRPRYDLLREAEATAFTREGRWEIAWQATPQGVTLRGRTPDGCRATLFDPTGSPLTEVAGAWQLPISLPTPA